MRENFESTSEYEPVPTDAPDASEATFVAVDIPPRAHHVRTFRSHHPRTAKPAAEQDTTEPESLEDEVSLADLDEEATGNADSVRVYLNQIGKVALLNAEEEVELARRIEAGLFAETILAFREGDGTKRQEIEQSVTAGVAARLEAATKVSTTTGQTAKAKTAKQQTEAAEKARLELDKQKQAEAAEAMQVIGKLAAATTLPKRDLQRLVLDGERAKTHLYEANLRLVVSLAKRYTGQGVLFLDLIQEGNIGLDRAVEKFDYAKGFKFSTYATWWIRQAITRAMADQARTIRIPVHMVEQITKLQRVTRELQGRGLEATPEELAVELDISPSKVKELQGYARSPISLDQVVGDDNDASFGDFIADDSTASADDIVEHDEMNRALYGVLATLNPREEAVIRMRYGIGYPRPYTLDEIGQEFKLSRERIRQIEKEVKHHLQDPSRKSLLEGFLND